MTDSDLETCFSLMGAKLSRGSGNRKAQCPLAPWTHNGGKDKNPSCTVKAADPAVFKCWACQSQGSVRKLAKLYAEHSGDQRAYEFARRVERFELGDRIKSRGSYYDCIRSNARIRKEDQADSKPFVEKDLELFMQSVPKYAIERGLTKEQILRWEIGYDIPRRRMIFTIRDYLGKFIGVSGRDLTGEKPNKYKHYPGCKKELLLYGEQFIDRDVKRGYVVEGFFDVLTFERAGIKNTLASMGTSLSIDQMQKLARWFQEIVFVPDCDDAGFGLQFAEVYSEKLLLIAQKVGIAGVRRNTEYVKRHKPLQWEKSDYKYVPIEVLSGKEPDALSPEEREVVLSTIEWAQLGD